MANEIDILMDTDPLELSAQNIDDIIAFQRKYRANKEAGVKQEKVGQAPKLSLDLHAMGLIKPSTAIKRRI